MNSDHLLPKVVLICALTVIGSGGAAALVQRKADNAGDQAARAATFARDIRASQVEGCHRTNRLKRGLRADKHQDIKESRNANPADFPDIRIERFRELRARAIAADQRILAKFPLTNCRAAYPEKP